MKCMIQGQLCGLGLLLAEIRECLECIEQDV